MVLLAIDTALDACSVAVCRGSDDGQLSLTQWSRVLGRGHAEILMQAINNVLGRSGTSYADIDRIAVTVGPGSFTGLRVGLSVARGLALVLECPVVGVGTLAAIAAEHHQHHPRLAIGVALDARRDQVYCQVFGADTVAVGEPTVCSAVEFAGDLLRHEAVGLVGSGAAAVAAAALKTDIHLPLLSEQRAPSIRSVAEVALRADRPGLPPRPFYLRPPDAKRQSAGQVARK